MKKYIAIVVVLASLIGSNALARGTSVLPTDGVKPLVLPTHPPFGRCCVGRTDPVDTGDTTTVETPAPVASQHHGGYSIAYNKYLCAKYPEIYTKFFINHCVFK